MKDLSQSQALSLESYIPRESELYVCLGGRTIESISCLKCNYIGCITSTNPNETIKYFYCKSVNQAKRMFLKQ
jgi:hypothetical protein